jgi:hypothetical protein
MGDLDRWPTTVDFDEFLEESGIAEVVVEAREDLEEWGSHRTRQAWGDWEKNRQYQPEDDWDAISPWGHGGWNRNYPWTRRRWWGWPRLQRKHLLPWLPKHQLPLQLTAWAGGQR